MGIRSRGLTAAACAFALLAGACSSGSKSSSAGPGTASTRLVIRLAASTQSGGYPTPFGAVRGPGVLATSFMFDTLAFPDVTGVPKPWLAKSWESSSDAKTWTFHLRDNVKWQDGQPLTADDVVFSFNYDLKGPGASTGVAQGVNYIDTVTAPDPSTVVITLKTVRPSFIDDVAGSFSGIAIIPKHIWEKVTDPAHFQSPEAVIGSGPYRLTKFDVTTNTFDYVANDDFYLGKPAVREVQVIQVADPLLALDRGDIDAASTGNSAIPKSQFDALSAKFKLLTAPGEFTEALFFNPAGGFPYDQTTFRQAVAYALNRPDMITRLVSGRGVPGSAGQLGPGNPYLDKSVPDYAYDPVKANTLLDQLGLKSVNGVRTTPDGSPLSIPLLGSAADIQQAQLVSEYLRAVGLKVDIATVDQATSDARAAKGAYSLAIVHFGGLSADPSGLIPRFSSTSKSKSFTRVVGYKNPEFDKVAAQEAVTVDPAARKQLADQMQAILANDLPELNLYVPDQVSFVNTAKFGGWAYTPGCPPCGVAMNKRILVAGNADPAPSN